MQPQDASSWFRLGLGAQVTAGVLMIGLGIGSAPLWNDEIASVSAATRSLGDMFRLLGNVDTNMGFYYLLLHFWSMWGGDSEAWVRMLSAVPAVATIPVTAILARRLFGDAVGLTAGFLMVGSMFVVAYGQNARSYALALLLTTVASLLFVEAVRTRRPMHFVAYGTTSVLAVYAAPLSGLVLVAHAASLPLLPQARGLLRPFAFTYGAALAAVVPFAAAMFAVGSQQVGWIDRPGPNEVIRAAGAMLGAGNAPLAVAYCLLIAIGLIAFWRGRVDTTPQEDTWRWRRALVIGWLFLPAGLLFVISQVQPLFVARYLLPSAPAMAITAAVGLVALARHSRPLGVAVAGTMICIALLARVGVMTEVEIFLPRPYQAAAQMIASQSIAGDGIAYQRVARRNVEWYIEREAMPGADLPVDFAVASGGQPSEVGHFYAREVPYASLSQRLRRHPRVWLVEWEDYAPPTAAALLRSEYRRVGSHDFEHIRVQLYVREIP